MREIMRREPPPKSGNFFELTIGELEEVFKLPNFATRQELLSLYAKTSTDGEGGDLLRAMAATLGACWWGQAQALEAEYFEHRGNLIRFGDLVLTELEDAGLPVAGVMAAGGACINRIVESIPQEQEVAEKEAFSKAEAGA